MSQDSKQYSCIIRFLDDSEPLTVTYQVSDVLYSWLSNIWLFFFTETTFNILCLLSVAE